MNEKIQKEVNLKGKEHKLVYYRTLKDNAKIEKSRWMRDKDGEFKEFFYYDTVTKNVFFNEQKVREFSLDGIGKNLEHEDNQFTIIHNYLIQFWQHFLRDSFSVYITLKSMCIQKDYCWPALPTIQEMTGIQSKNTLKSKLATLEEYGFVFRFNCKPAERVETDNRNRGMDESPLYKIRRRVPFLPKELYEELPEGLKEQHDNFMHQYMSAYNPDNLAQKIDYNQIYNEYLGQGKEVFAKFPVNRHRMALSKLEQLKETLTLVDEELTLKLHDHLKNNVSKPSYETWFVNMVVKLREEVITVYANNHFNAEWIQDKYLDIINVGFEKFNINPLSIKVVSIEE